MSFDAGDIAVRKASQGKQRIVVQVMGDGQTPNTLEVWDLWNLYSFQAPIDELAKPSNVDMIEANLYSRMLQRDIARIYENSQHTRALLANTTPETVAKPKADFFAAAGDDDDDDDDVSGPVAVPVQHNIPKRKYTTRMLNEQSGRQRLSSGDDTDD